MPKYKVPLNGQLFELANGRQLVPGEVEELTSDEAKESAAEIKAGTADGRLLKIEGGESKT